MLMLYEFKKGANVGRATKKIFKKVIWIGFYRFLSNDFNLNVKMRFGRPFGNDDDLIRDLMSSNLTGDYC